MTLRLRYLLSIPFLSIPVCSAACGSSVVSGNTGGFGGSGGPGTTTTAVTTTTTTTTTSATTSTGSGGGPGAQPPPPGPFVAPDGSGSTTFAIKRLYFGDTDRDGTPNLTSGWKQYGYDIDHTISSATSTDLCKPLANASPKNVYPDGDAGIDNSFGKNILPILLGLQSDFSLKQNEAFAQGKQTFMIDLVQLGAGDAYNPLPSRLYPGAALGSPPHFDGTDVWPIDPAGLFDPADPGSAKVVFSQSYLTGNTWVGLGTGAINLTLDTAGFPLPLVIHDPVVTMALDASHTSATNGTFAGVLYVSEFVAALKQTAGNFDPSLCSGPTIQSIVAQIQQAGDILADGSQDPSKSCEAISIGLGFDASRVTIGNVAPAKPPPPNPCP